MRFTVRGATKEESSYRGQSANWPSRMNPCASSAPEQALRSQVVVMHQLVAVAAVAGFAAVSFARRLIFTGDAQLRT